MSERVPLTGTSTLDSKLLVERIYLSMRRSISVTKAFTLLKRILMFLNQLHLGKTTPFVLVCKSPVN